jgi:hypothetical protein
MTDVVAVLLGVASSAVWLVIVFSVKPRVKVTLVIADGQPPECRGFDVENLGLGQVIEVEARVWRIGRGGGLDRRKKVPLKTEQLLTLSGKWHESRRSAWELEHEVGDSYFRFLLPDGTTVSAADLADSRDRYLVQISCTQAFTNFGRVHIFRIGVPESGNCLKVLDQTPKWTGKTIGSVVSRCIARLSECFPRSRRARKVELRTQRAQNHRIGRPRDGSDDEPARRSRSQPPSAPGATASPPTPDHVNNPREGTRDPTS